MKILEEKITEEMTRMKRHGYTLQRIADKFGISREAVRQRIKRYCEEAGLPYPVSARDRAKHFGLLSARVITNRLGCSLPRLIHYRKQGIVDSRRIGRYWFYNEMEIVEIMSLLSKCDGYFYKVNPREYRKRSRALWQDPEFIDKYRKGIKAKPNKAELEFQSILDEHYPNTYKYVGDYQVCIGGKFPDFININGKKEVLELFGSFYHKFEQVESTIDHYNQYGFSCIVIWEEELKDVKGLLKHIEYGGIYIPKLLGSTIFDYRKVKIQIILDPITNKFSQIIN